MPQEPSGEVVNPPGRTVGLALAEVDDEMLVVVLTIVLELLLAWLVVLEAKLEEVEEM